MTSLPPWPNTWISAVLATVAVPPLMATAPPFTRIVPAALRANVMVLLRLSPNVVRSCAVGLKVAVTAIVVFLSVAAPAQPWIGAAVGRAGLVPANATAVLQARCFARGIFLEICLRR